MSHFNGHSECTCGEDQPNFNERECREFYWNRRRRTSGRQADCIIEESSEHSTDDEKINEKEEEEEGRHRASSTKGRRKSVSRSSSGIGTLGTVSSHHSRGGHRGKLSSDETSRSSRGLSPALEQEVSGEISENDRDLNDNYEEEDIKEALYKGKNKMKQLGDSKFGSLKSLKKALSKKSLFKNKKKDQNIEDERFETEPKTPVLGKYGRKSVVSNQDDDFGSFTEEEEEEEDSYSLSDFEEPEAENLEENYSRVDKLRSLRARSKSYGNLSVSDRELEERRPSRQRQSSGADRRNDRVTEAERKYLRQYKGDMMSSSDSEQSDRAPSPQEVRVKGRKYSSQMKECEYDSKDELLTDKPAMNTLKKTFTAMLSRIGSRRMMGGGTGDTSSDNISINSRYSNALETRALADKPFSLRRALSRASSVNSVNLTNSAKTSESGKKTFMYFSSDVGKGFIISDDEEVTGVISVMNMSRKKTKKIREKITGTITDTLKRNAKRKRSKAGSDIPNFLFVNKPYFSSEESLADITPPVVASSNSSNSPASSRTLPLSSRSKRYRSEMMLRIPSRTNIEQSGEESETEQYSTLGRGNKTRPRSRHSTSTYRDDYHETPRDKQSREAQRHRRKKTT